MTDYAVARANMVENQLRPSRIDDPGVLKAMGEMPRELFVPEALRLRLRRRGSRAGPGGRHLIEPLALAKLVQAAAPDRGRGLVIGDVTGYAAAVLARPGRHGVPACCRPTPT